ncbi:hypothetical protein KP001_02240 [Geomonas subterranea]|uniref:Uncharacterized protein n=1 Tax=Geomonas subterranea TaxID=2847989 RepID=A0ABX8LH78_9BACT|nr:hypothetical protein [Geomonas subterranea]QXE91386.1 hypothetical protein KP001_02240 [Geomonas subterranea]QXM10527.1 hypothetical protein KP002_05255 [Geomonas subterranea]
MKLRGNNGMSVHGKGHEILAKRLIVAAAVAAAITGTLAGCAARQQVLNNQDYVEIDSPFPGEAGDANAKIWVPKASLEKGVPRGREVAKIGYEKLAAAKVTDAATVPRSPLRLRLLVAESGRQQLSQHFAAAVGKALVVRQAAPPSPADALTEAEALSYLGTVSGNASGPLLFLSKPEGTHPGARLKADLYDVRGPLVIRSFWVAVPEPAPGQSEQEALLSAVKGLAETAVRTLSWFPWYGRVARVSGERVYLDGGAEAGLAAGQQVTVYRGGEVVKGIGFAPGTHIATLRVNELFGSDGSVATSTEAAQVQAGDYVELESPP